MGLDDESSLHYLKQEAEILALGWKLSEYHQSCPMKYEHDTNTSNTNGGQMQFQLLYHLVSYKERDNKDIDEISISYQKNKSISAMLFQATHALVNSFQPQDLQPFSFC